MLRALYTGATGLKAQQTMTDVTANNIANVNTVGFKKDRAEFQDLIYQVLRVAGSQAGGAAVLPTGLEIGLGSRIAATKKDFTQGSYIETGRTLDLTIEGDGFFRFTLPDGTIGYSRDGALTLDGEGNLVNNSGYILDPAITFPADAISVTIQTDGTVWVQLPGETELSQVGQITLSRFVNPAGLQAVGSNMFRETAASGAPTDGVPGEEGFGTTRQYFLEQSNVSMVDELIQLIIAQRAFETNSKTIQTSDEILGIAANLKR
ncbi:MAG: flagellar basal-body rod protein FlgG [bacterium]|jgi:flagellar basal-body rod protein FlgG